MMATVPFVDTTIVPDRNAGIASLLWDLQHPRDPDRDGPPLLGPAFAFIDVGVSRAAVPMALKALLVGDLKLEVGYVATERLEAVPCATVTSLGTRAEAIRGYLSRLISSRETAREVNDWHYVVDQAGKVSSVAYAYDLQGNVVWEAYFMGGAFMVSGERVAFSDPTLEEMLAPDVAMIEARIASERARDGNASHARAWRDGYRIERDPLETGLAQCGITLQRTDVPHRITGRQNVLFIGNVLNHYPQGEQARQLDRIAANMEEGDIVILQTDEVGTASIEVLEVTRRGRERVRWIDTRTLEVQQRLRSSGSWQQVSVRPVLERTVSRLVDRLGNAVNSPLRGHEGHRVLLRRSLSQVFGAYFRALPVEETLRIAIREAVARVSSEGGPRGIPVFPDDPDGSGGGAPGSDPGPVGSDAERTRLGPGHSRRGVARRPESRRHELRGAQAGRKGHR